MCTKINEGSLGIFGVFTKGLDLCTVFIFYSNPSSVDFTEQDSSKMLKIPPAYLSINSITLVLS